MLSRFRAGVRALWHRDRMERELDEEMRHHLQRLIEQYAAEGLSPREARNAALKEFGGVEQAKQQCRDARGVRPIEDLWQDLRYGARALAKRPGFALVAIATLALGIGANTAIFSVVNTVLLKPLPYKDPDHLVSVAASNPQKGLDTFPVAPADFADWRDQSTVFEDIATSRNATYTLTGKGEPESIMGYRFSENFFRVMGVEPILGRTFTPEEDRPGSNQVVVISYRLWQQLFGGDTSAIGQSLTLNGQSYTIIGVMPASFEHPTREVQVWTPLALPPSAFSQRGGNQLRLIARLKPGATVEQASAELNAIAGRLAEQYPQTNAGWGVRVRALPDERVGDIKTALLVLLWIVGFVLLIACANVANLLLARSTARQKEIAIRTAIGASRGRLIRQFLTESLLLSCAGGATGLLLAFWGVNGLLAIFPRNIYNLDIPLVEEIPIDAKVLAFTAAVAILTGLLFGLLPSLQASNPDLNETLKEGGRGSTRGVRGRRARSLLVVFEVAVTVLLMIVAGLLMKSFLRLQRGELGFNTDNILSLRIQLPGYKYREPDQQRNFFAELERRLGALPQVESEGAVMFLPLSGWQAMTQFTVEGQPPPAPGEEPEADYQVATADYFKAIGIPLIKGRYFTAQDSNGSVPVAIIDETLADRYWPGEDPVGRQIIIDDGDTKTRREVVGVVGQVRHLGLEEKSNPTVYLPFLQAPAPVMCFALKTKGDPESLAAAVRREAYTIDKDQPITHVMSMRRLAAESLAPRRVSMLLTVCFAAVAMLLAALGIYGVISYSVSQRTQEIGIRMALGAQAADVLKMVIGDGMRLALVGVGVGLVAALILTRLIASLLYGVSATDPLTFALIALLLTSVALLACYLPARRATKVDLMIALRYE